jgi:hypothetical protein
MKSPDSTLPTFYYEPTDATEKLREAGILAIVLNPLDGVDRSTVADWSEATWSVVASIVKGEPTHQLVARYPDPEAMNGMASWAAGIRTNAKTGRPEAVTTIAGGNIGAAPLSAKQGLELASLVWCSINRGFRQRRSTQLV